MAALVTAGLIPFGANANATADAARQTPAPDTTAQSAAIPEFWASGEVTGHEYITYHTWTDREPHQDLASATNFVNNNCPGGSFCFVQRDPYGWGGVSAWVISGCETFWVRGALDTFRVNNRITRYRRTNLYNANRTWIGQVLAGEKKSINWNQIYYFATCRP